MIVRVFKNQYLSLGASKKLKCVPQLNFTVSNVSLRCVYVLKSYQRTEDPHTNTFVRKPS